MLAKVRLVFAGRGPLLTVHMRVATIRTTQLHLFRNALRAPQLFLQLRALPLHMDEVLEHLDARVLTLQQVLRELLGILDVAAALACEDSARDL